MAKPDLGKKHICQSCSAPFYDLNRKPAVCPKCDTEVVALVKGRKVAAEKVKPAEEKPAESKDSEELDDLDNIEVLVDADDDLADDDLADEEDDDDLIEDASDLGADDDDMSEVKEHIDLGVEDGKD